MMMIHYDLRCADGHSFDGWFRSSAAFDHQALQGLLGCPICASTQVDRAIMAPRVSSGLRAIEPPAAIASPEVISADSAHAPRMTVAPSLPMPDQVRAVLQLIRAEVEQRCDYVGPRFADEARAIHQGDQPPRPIYGETTPEQAEALAEDGIEVARIPWIPRADS